MSWRFAVPAAVRIGVVISVVLSGMTFGAYDAEARRIKVRSKDHSTSQNGSGQDGTAKTHKSQDDADEGSSSSSGGSYIPGVRVRSREAARGDAATTDDTGGAPTRRRSAASRAAALPPEQDADVPGCPTGMICTVCVAGCEGASGSIVDAQPKTPRPARRN